jgi:hypothetical protein
MVLSRKAKRRSSMSLKFAALGYLTVLSALRTPARADDQAQNLGPVGPRESILTTVGHRRSAAEPEKPEVGGRVIKREALGATRTFATTEDGVAQNENGD